MDLIDPDRLSTFFVAADFVLQAMGAATTFGSCLDREPGDSFPGVEDLGWR